MYPRPGDHHPPELLPERPFDGSETGGNHVYTAVRRCLRAAGLDASRADSPAWNPLGHWIREGDRVFVLPNFVVHPRPGESADDFSAKCTNGAFLRPVLDYVVRACGDAALVGFGNAALQSCDYDRVTHATGADIVAQFFRQRTGADIGPHDLRAVVTEWTRYGALLRRVEKDEDQVVYVDLGRDSLLDPLYRNDGLAAFRVSDYDRRDIEAYHGPGRHVYALHRRVLDADVIVSAPKLKTHEKVGITCALKGTVGAIARKECLAHHRRGGPGTGGDEFPSNSIARRAVSAFSDRITTLGHSTAANAARVAAKGMYRLLRMGPQGIMAGAWHGNDTAWRMAADIARILRFARPDGTLADSPQRRHLAFIDGVVGGEAEGPVYPRAIHAGIVMFGSDPVWTDAAAAGVMQFDRASIPLVARARDVPRFPLTELDAADVRWLLNGQDASLEALSHVLTRGFQPPKGWPRLSLPLAVNR